MERFFRNKVVFWTGDSIMNLVAHAAACEAAKSFSTVHAGPFIPSLPPHIRSFFSNLSHFTAEDAVSGGQLFIGGTVPRSHGRARLPSPLPPTPAGPVRRTAATRGRGAKAHRRRASAGPPHSAYLLEETGTLFVSKGWHHWKESDMKAQMALADVILVNYAMHYYGQFQGDYNPHMTQAGY